MMGGSAFGPQGAGPPSAHAASATRPLAFSCGSAQSTLRTKASDRPSDSERRQRSAARPLSPFARRPAGDIGYPVRGTAHSSSGLGRRPLTAVARVRIPYAPFAPAWLLENRMVERDGRVRRAGNARAVPPRVPPPDYDLDSPPWRALRPFTSLLEVAPELRRLMPTSSSTNAAGPIRQGEGTLRREARATVRPPGRAFGAACGVPKSAREECRR
jgi:hypothetical protein